MSEIKDPEIDSDADALLSHVTSLLSGAAGPVTEGRLWETIAATYSPEWRDAYQELQRVENPNNQPLGPIDMALEPPEAREDRLLKQAGFTVIDENLRDVKVLREVFLAAKERYNVLEVSLRLSQDIAEATESIPQTEMPGMSLTRMFGLSSLSLFRKAFVPAE